MGYTYTETIEEPKLSDLIAYLLEVLKSGEVVIIHGNDTGIKEELIKAGFQEVDGVWNNEA